MVRSLSCALVLSLVACSAADPGGTTGDEQDVTGASLQLSMRLADSKLVYSSKIESFGLKDGKGLDLPCRERSIALSSKPSLYSSAWTPEGAPAFAEDVPDARYHDYSFASCRDAETQAFAWFPKERDIELSIGDQLVAEDYQPKKLPLTIEVAKIGGASKFYTCDGAFEKKLVEETANAKHYDMSVTCKPKAAPGAAEHGLVDFVRSPGPYAHVVTYKPWILPPIASNAESFERVKGALLAQVPAGSYTGAMSTLAKTCGLAVEVKGDALVVDHTIQSSNRTRHLELRASALLGFVEGDLRADPIRAAGDVQGRFAAAEFDDGKGGSVVVRFEKNTTLDAGVVRIDGAEAYCRRLVAK